VGKSIPLPPAKGPPALRRKSWILDEYEALAAAAVEAAQTEFLRRRSVFIKRMLKDHGLPENWLLQIHETTAQAMSPEEALAVQAAAQAAAQGIVPGTMIPGGAVPPPGGPVAPGAPPAAVAPATPPTPPPGAAPPPKG